jgi:hypothetical protein
MLVPLKHELASRGIALNTTSANEHVPKIERQICVIKERVCATRHTLPFKVLPLIMLIELVHSSILWINAFPPKGGASTNPSPRNIMTSIQFDCNTHCQLQFGNYVQAHQEPDPTNAQAARTVGAICLGPTGNMQGSCKFLNLRTGKRITCRRWTLLPMPQEVIERVNQLGTADGQPELLTFYDRKGRMIGETETPGVPHTPQVNNQEDDGLGDLDPPTVNDEHGVMEQTEIDECVPDIVQQVEDPTLEPEVLPDPQAQVPDETHQQPPEQTSTEVSDPGVPDQGAPVLHGSERDHSKPKRLVPVFGRTTYESAAAVTTHLVHPDDHLDPDYVLVAHHAMVQCSLKTGMKHFKERGEKLVSKELAQLRRHRCHGRP